MRIRRGVAVLAVLAVVTAAASCSDDTNPDTAGTPSGATPTPTVSASRPTGEPSPTPSRPTGEPTPSGPTSSGTPGGAACVTRVLDAMPLLEQAAQLVMSGIRTSGPRSSQRAALRDQKPGGVLLIGAGGSAGAVEDVVDDAVEAIGPGRGVRPFVAADQEGGQIQRLKGTGFERMPSAQVQGTWSESRLTARATVWGRDLAAVGVNVDLAPVADVVPAGIGDRNEPIGALDRNFGSTPDAVGGPVAAFVRGMHAAGVMTSVKHFPGLGRVRGNTDFSAGVVDGVTVRNDPLLAPFSEGIRAGTDMVMIATATYDRIDSRRRAVFSPTVIRGMLRGDLRYAGVVISDDVGAAKEVAAVPVGERATRFVAAGGDIVITAESSLVRPMIDALVEEAERDAEFRTAVTDSTRRILTLKQRRGLVSC